MTAMRLKLERIRAARFIASECKNVGLATPPKLGSQRYPLVS
jgi:hypothetical protein